MPAAHLSPAAERDIENIWDYTEERWGRRQSVRYVRDLQAVCAGLADGSTPSRSADDIREGYRKAACGSHTAYFRIDSGRTVIVRILHQSMDVDRHL